MVKIMAGLVAETFGNWLEIEYLFVRRTCGDKESDLNYCKAESEAKRKLSFAFVNTYQFQASAFYQKQGYKEVFTLKIIPTLDKGTIIKRICRHKTL